MLHAKHKGLHSNAKHATIVAGKYEQKLQGEPVRPAEKKPFEPDPDNTGVGMRRRE